MTPLINALIEKNLITAEELNDARDKQVGAKKPIHELLIEMGFVKEEDMVLVSSEVFNMPVFHLEEETIDPSGIKLIPYETAKKYGVFPVRKEGDTLILATSDPQDVIALDDIRIIVKSPVKAVLSTKGEISKFTEEKYQSDETLYDLLKNIVSDSKVEIVEEGISGRDLGDLRVESSPVVKLVNLMFADALRSRASDIHIEPQENFTEVRYRIDGDLRNIMKVPAKLHNGIVSRIKVMANLNIAEKREPQDGRAGVSVDNKKFDVRVSTVPTYHGETVVMRLLDKESAVVNLDGIGMDENSYKVFSRAIRSPQGMILVTGPTGSGKTSTLYAALNSINEESKNIITIEDPIEYLLEGVNQIQVNPIKNVTFASGLRSILRQDPNVVLVGEIRDKETAQIAFQASLTGHLVFSTLHTNNAVSTATRLKDIGLEDYLISSSVSLILAQRLVRVICPHCTEKYDPDKDALDKFKTYIDKYSIKEFYTGKGCDKCAFTGFTGRIGIFEMLPFDEKIRELVSSGATGDAILKEATSGGMKTLAEAGVEKVAKKITTLEEVAKVADVSEEAPAAPQAIPTEEAAPAREKPLILIADDEDDIRMILKKRLTDAGYEVIQARNGKEELELAARETPDLIITDLMMPEMDGVEATRALRSSLSTASIPIIMLTAKQEKASELEGLDAGADDYITKPFDKDKLLARVKMLLKRSAR